MLRSLNQGMCLENIGKFEEAYKIYSEATKNQESKNVNIFLIDFKIKNIFFKMKLII